MIRKQSEVKDASVQDTELTKNIALTTNKIRASLKPDQIRIRNTLLKSKTPVSNYEGIQLLYVHAGSGKIVINGKHYPLYPGVLLFLYSYDFSRIIPQGEEGLQISRIYLSYQGFLFLMITSMDLVSIDTLASQQHVAFDAHEQTDIESTLRLLNAADPRDIDLTYSLILEVIGRICRKLS